MCEFDREIVLDLLQRIDETLDTITRRFQTVPNSEFFNATEEGRERRDGLCMLYEAVGECLKKIDKLTSGRLLTQYPKISWKGVMRLRDVIAHHYFEINTEMLFTVSREHLPDLSAAVKKIIVDLTSYDQP